MNHIYRKNPFWSVAGPLIAYWGIQIGVQFIIQAIIQVPMMTSAYLEQFLNGQITNSEEVMESYCSGGTGSWKKVSGLLPRRRWRRTDIFRWRCLGSQGQ